MPWSTEEFHAHLDFSAFENVQTGQKSMGCEFIGRAIGRTIRIEALTWEGVWDCLPEWARKGVGGEQ